MQTEIVIALIAAIGSLVVAVATALLAVLQARDSSRLHLETETKLKKLEDDLGRKAALHDARLEYEYEALKDLYKTTEPILFQLHELCQQMYERVRSLARTAQQGKLDEKEGWLSGPGYYLISTIYTLLAPLAAFKLLQRRITFVDIGLDASIGRRYYVARAIYSMLSEHHELALSFTPVLEYDPNNQDSSARRYKQPAIYWRQGVAGQRLDAAAEAMLVEVDGAARLRTYHEFESEFRKEKGGKLTISETFAPFYDIFLDFHPRSRPVLWRILVTQARLCELFMRSRAHSERYSWADIGDFDLTHADVRSRFDWRKPGDDVSDKEALDVPFAIAEAYLRSRVPFAAGGSNRASPAAPG